MRELCVRVLGQTVCEVVEDGLLAGVVALEVFGVLRGHAMSTDVCTRLSIVDLHHAGDGACNEPSSVDGA